MLPSRYDIGRDSCRSRVSDAPGLNLVRDGAAARPNSAISGALTRPDGIPRVSRRGRGAFFNHGPLGYLPPGPMSKGPDERPKAAFALAPKYYCISSTVICSGDRSRQCIRAATTYQNPFIRYLTSNRNMRLRTALGKLQRYFTLRDL